jgi:hypothetical protein
MFWNLIKNRKTDILKKSADARAKNVEDYQINIDNFRLAISEIEYNHPNDPEMTQYAEQLRSLLNSSLQEQKKEMVMLKVIRRQLEE